MAGSGSPTFAVDGTGMKVAIVASLWHEQVMAGLIAGANRQAQACDVDVTLFRVPGSFELTVAALTAAKSGFDAVVALGVIIRGGTPHFEYVSHGVTMGLTHVGIETNTPIGFGVLTCDNDEQAFDRAGLPGSSEDKGAEAMAAAVATVATLKQIAESAR